jgi:hypothetical protein
MLGEELARRVWPAPTARSAAAALTDLLGAVAGHIDRVGVPFMVVGSLAGAFYGAPRTIADVDIVIDTDAIALTGLDPSRFFVDVDTARVVDTDTGWTIDVAICKNRRSASQSCRAVAAPICSECRSSSRRPRTSSSASSSGRRRAAPNSRGQTDRRRGESKQAHHPRREPWP